MTRDCTAPVFRWGALGLWSCLFLGAGAVGPGCAPGTPTQADAQAPPGRLKAMQEKGRAAIASKNAKRSGPQAPKSSTP